MTENTGKDVVSAQTQTKPEERSFLQKAKDFAVKYGPSVAATAGEALLCGAMFGLGARLVSRKTQST